MPLNFTIVLVLSAALCGYVFGIEIEINPAVNNSPRIAMFYSNLDIAGADAKIR